MNKCIVFLATAWGSRDGGINSFNHELCRTLGKLDQSALSIVCIVNEATEDDIRNASGSGVILIHLNKQQKDAVILSLLLKDRDLKPEWIVGHDVHTEPRASELSAYLNIPLALFNHMDYSAYKSHQILLGAEQGPEARKKAQKYVQDQEEILQKAQIVFAIGPKLKKSATDKVSTNVTVIEILPGLTNNLQLRGRLPENFSAITLGRFGKGTNLIKQTSLAVASFAEAVNRERSPLNSDPQLRIIGFQGDDANLDELFSIAGKYTKKPYQLHPWEYTEEQGTLVQSLCRRTVCVVPSLHEGFSLVGLQAISAEIPLVLSRNTGLYLAVKDALGKKGTRCLWDHEILMPPKDQLYNKDNVKLISDSLIDIHDNKEDSKDSARELRELLLDKGWTWEKAACDVLEGLGFEENQSSKSLMKNVIHQPISSNQPATSETKYKKLQAEVNHYKAKVDHYKAEVDHCKAEQALIYEKMNRFSEELNQLGQTQRKNNFSSDIFDDKEEQVANRKEILKLTREKQLLQYQLQKQESDLERIVNERQKELNERQKKLNEIEVEITKEDPEIKQVVMEWLSESKLLAEKYGKLALRESGDIELEMQSDPSRLDVFYWELGQLVTRIRASLVSRKSTSQGFKILGEPAILISIPHSNIYIRALEILKEGIPSYVEKGARIDLEIRIDYLLNRLKCSILPTAQQLNEGEELLSTSHHQDSNRARVISNQSISSEVKIESLKIEVHPLSNHSVSKLDDRKSVLETKVFQQKQELDELEIRIIESDQDITEALSWLAEDRVLAERLGRMALKKYKNLNQEMQVDPSRLDDFYWELQELIGQVYDSLVTRASMSTKGYKVLNNPSIPTSIDYSDVHVYALELLKTELPPYRTHLTSLSE